ncbi:MAG: 3-ketoacyl-ACP reductase [Acidobacteria bacterium]|nr:MAG: 3-ketoacyl-ACP reductase [Acidobacteriota bacterium]
MALTLEGKNAVITGSSRGIGRAIAERLAAAGASVIVNYRQNSELAQQVVNGIHAIGGKAKAIQADVSRIDQIKNLFDQSEKALGGLDIVVANAGVLLQKPLSECTEEDYDSVFNVNTKGVFFTLKEGARRVRDGGRIIVVSSSGTKMGFGGVSLYLGSKGAIEQFVRSLSRELGPRNITANVLSPGFTETDMFIQEWRSLAASLSPFNRIGSVEEVADVAVFLASDQARWITGQNVQSNGGAV